MAAVGQHDVASVLVLDPGATQVLLLRHPEHGRWGPVGGHLTGGELPSAAARRELREETGLTTAELLEPHLAVLQDLYACADSSSPLRHVDHLFAAVVDPADAAPLPPGVGWFPLLAPPEPLVPGLRLHLRSAARAVEAQAQEQARRARPRG